MHFLCSTLRKDNLYAVVLAPFWPKGSSFNRERIATSQSQSCGQESQQVSDLLCLLLHVFSLILFFHTLASSWIFLWDWNVLYFVQPCCDVLFLVGCIDCCAPTDRGRLSNAGFISKGRVFWIQWLGRICLWILSTENLVDGVLSIFVKNRLFKKKTTKQYFIIEN